MHLLVVRKVFSLNSGIRGGKKTRVVKRSSITLNVITMEINAREDKGLEEREMKYVKNPIIMTMLKRYTSTLRVRVVKD